MEWIISLVICPQFLSSVPADWWFCIVCVPPTLNPLNKLQILPGVEFYLSLVTPLSFPAGFCTCQASEGGLLDNKDVYKISSSSLNKILGGVGEEPNWNIGGK